MDPISTALIAAASVGAASGVSEVSKRAIVDAYEGLKELLKQRLGKKSDVLEAVKQIEEKPDREGPKITLQEEILESGADRDPKLIDAARALLILIDSAGIGERSTNITASGERSVAAQSITGSTVKTGDEIKAGGAVFMGDVKAGRDVIGRDKIDKSKTGTSAEDLAAAFAKIYATLEKQPAGPEKTVAEQAVKAIEEEAGKGEEASEEQAGKWMTVLEKTLPDVAEVVVDALLSPGAAVGTVIRKVAQRAREGSKKKD